MNDEEIRQALNQACQYLDMDLYLQVSLQPPYLYIFINRPVGSSPNYADLIALLGKTIADLELEGLPFLAFYSRPFGEIEHDWELCVEVKDFIQETLVVHSTQIQKIRPQPLDAEAPGSEDVTANESTEDDVTEFVEHRANQPFTSSEDEENTLIRGANEELAAATSANYLNTDDFSRYCFVDNPQEISDRPQAVSPKVAKSLAVFHRFPVRGKHRVLPLLGQIFEGDRGIVFVHFPEPVQQWFEHILTLTEAELQAAKLWFSRYCQDKTETLREMQQVLQQAQESLNAQAAPPSSSTETHPDMDDCPTRLQLVTDDVSSDAPGVDASDASGVDSSDAPDASNLVIEETATARLKQNDRPLLLWIGFGLLGLGSLCLGGMAAFICPEGLGMGGWFLLLLALLLQTFCIATANRNVQKIQGGIFTVAFVASVVNTLFSGLIVGYGAGWLLGLGVGNLLRWQFRSSQKRLPRNFAGVWELLSDRTGTIALAIALIFFACPMLLNPFRVG